MSKDTALSTVDDISQDISGVEISDSGDICKSCSDTTNMEICANCGKEGDSLKSCAACKLVKYCSRDCQIAHRKLHKKECRKRVAELHDEKLFKDPPSLNDDCPICFLRLPTHTDGSRYKGCCGKVICSGCIYAVAKRDEDALCPFCRVPTAMTDEEIIKRLHKRADADDVLAIHALGIYYSERKNGPLDYDKAMGLWEQAAEIGHDASITSIGRSYIYGYGVEKDEKKALHYWELAAMGGCSNARYNLGVFEHSAGNKERALRHYMIAVESGHNGSLKQIQELYSEGKATKDEYTKALRAYQKYLGEVKSRQRDEAAAAFEGFKYYA